MQNTQNLPSRPFQEAQAKISKEKEKNQLVWSLTERIKKISEHLPFESVMKSGPGFLKKRRNFSYDEV